MKKSLTAMISIIIPVYNAELYLRDCIDSILSQSFKHFELLLIDDGSKDNSGAICDEYALKDSRVMASHYKNQGVSVARNLGLKNAHGEWIMFVDADDYLLPHSIKSLYQAATDNHADFVYGNTIRRDGIKDKHIISNLKDQSWINDYGTLAHYGLWGCLFKSEIIKTRNVFFVEGQAYGEDMIFKLMYLKYVSNITTIAAPVYIYRVNPSSVTKSTNKIRSSHHQLKATQILRYLALSEKDNVRYKNTLLKTMKSSRKQVFNDVAFHTVKSDYEEIRKDYYRVLGKSFHNIALFNCSVFLIRFKKDVKNFIQNIIK